MEPNTPDTSNFLDWVEIKNFKSIKDLRLDCKRVNIFIGKPNVGKSNILEALGMLGAQINYNPSKLFEGYIRYSKLKNLFYDSDINNKIEIKTDGTDIKLSVEENDYSEIYRYDLKIEQFPSSSQEAPTINITYNVGEDGKKIKPKKPNSIIKSIRKYDFKDLLVFNNQNSTSLLAPHGSNLFVILLKNTTLWNEFSRLFSEQGLEFVLSMAEQTFVLQKKVKGQIYLYPYFSIADTFRRFIFYITAIESNANSVIVFEEPEVHSFPPYTQDVAYRMIYSETNQFFVSTHSPYLLQTLVESLGDDQLSVFVTYYENYETKVKSLTTEELSFVQEYSTDVFFNLDRFIPTSNAASVS
ncbi:AAA family ATPase [Fibrella sp. HMF5335]|uniref:AAA family ATPase n=1 Tax=Fibrella rubiginis TaxID=2817060 RepID=A0A939GKX9_9BACT|nr:AAA family ATPase [Fibrella rubiginis]MBO0938715.1 AAA family ATPase [Fibrella rubiginis]